VTLYHIIVEGLLAQPAQHMIDDGLARLDVLPGFRAGMKNVSLDEQRHIAFGVRLLADLHEEDPDGVRVAIVDKFREVLPWTTAVALPPNRDWDYVDPLGFSIVDLFEEGARLSEQRLRAIGLDIDNLPRFPLPLDLPPRERGARGVTLMQAGMIGPKAGPASRDPEAVEILFDTLRRGADGNAAPAGTTIQWDFPDADPWFLRLDNGATSIQQGRAPKPDLTLHVGFDDWVDVMAGREDPRKLMLTRRMRPKGSVRTLMRMGKIFG